MKQTKTISFNWDTYQSDKSKYTVVTRDGQSVSQLTKFDLIDEPSVFYGVSDTRQNIYRWHENGLYYKHDEKYHLDLMLQYEEEVKDNWVKVYKVKSSGRLITSAQSFNTKEEAMKSCNGLMDVEHVGVINLNDITIKTNSK